MRLLALLCGAALIGCASTSATSATDRSSREWIQQFDEETTVANRSSLRTDTVRAPLGTTMRAVVGAYEALEIPVTRVVDAERRLETRNVRVPRIADERISRFLDCGTGITGQRADRYLVNMSLSTSVHAMDAGTTRVVTEFGGTARPRDTSGGEVYCRSLGTFEVVLLEEIRRRAETGATP